MAATNSLVDAKVTLTCVRAFKTGTVSGKRSTVKTYTFEDSANGIAVGGNTNQILASDFGLTRIERCTNLLVYTTSGGASAKVYPAAPSSDGASVTTTNPYDATDASRGNPADVAIATTQTGMITVEGV